MDIGKAAATALQKLTTSTQSLVKSPDAPKPASLIPTNDREAAELRAWIDHGHHPEAEPVRIDQFARHLQFMKSSLPMQNVGEDAAKDRVTVYYQLLGKFSDAAMAYMVQRACAELQWFPMPSQCLEILADFVQPITDVDMARANLQSYAERQMADYHRRLRDGMVSQDEIDTRFPQWNRIAAEKGLLYEHGDGYVLRSKAIGTDVSICTPEEASAIRKQYGLFTQDEVLAERRRDREKLGPPRIPTRADYIALGMTPEQCDAAGIA